MFQSAEETQRSVTQAIRYSCVLHNSKEPYAHCSPYEWCPLELCSAQPEQPYMAALKWSSIHITLSICLTVPKASIISPFYNQEKQGSQRLRSFSEITKLVKGRTQNQTQVCLSKSKALSAEPLTHFSSQCSCSKSPFSLTITTRGSLENFQKHSETLKETYPGVKKHKAKSTHHVDQRQRWQRHGEEKTDKNEAKI